MKTFIFLSVLFMLTSCNTKPTRTSTPICINNNEIQLTQPDLQVKGELMTALKNRCSVRTFDTKTLDLETLSNLLWAANGINRDESAKRTAPSAVNAQDILIYVCMENGAFIYLPESHSLQLVSNQDLRKEIAHTQDFAKDAPISIVLVSDLSRFPFDNREKALQLACMDAGYVSQNVYLYCTIDHLATVARGTMNTDALKEALNLNDNQVPLLNHPIGYIKEIEQ